METFGYHRFFRIFSKSIAIEQGICMSTVTEPYLKNKIETIELFPSLNTTESAFKVSNLEICIISKLERNDFQSVSVLTPLDPQKVAWLQIRLEKREIGIISKTR